MAEVKLIDVCKVYKGNVKAVKEFNLEIKEGEFLVLVGPSGCGKSTTLRMIAGLEDITSGKIYIGDKIVNDLEPKDRDIAMVFQNYALYPHMSVFDNLAYSLNCHHVNKDTIKEKVNEVAKMLDIDQYLLRKPKELSGGQRQRVALGRCLIRSPKVFLFDEPLSNLDAKLRVSMRSEISKLHQRINGTFIYVTHDQTEAMTMGDRIVVMKDGVIQQVDTPVNLYEHPINVFVATFLGSPQMNIFEAKLLKNKVQIGNSITLDLTEKVSNKIINGYINKDIYLGIRPSDFTLGNKDDYDLYIPHIDLIEKLGNETLIYFTTDGKKESALASLKLDITNEINDSIYLKIDKNKLHLFNLEEESILKVNEINYINEKFVKEGNDLIIENKGKYLNYTSKQIYIDDDNRFDGLLSIRSEAFNLEKKDESDLEYKVRVLAYDVYSDKLVVYSNLIDNPEARITFFAPKGTKIDNGQIQKIYVASTNVGICDSAKNYLTVNESINHPLEEIKLEMISKNYYILSHDKTFSKNKYFVIDKIFDLDEKMIINVHNEKNENKSFILKNNPDLYVSLIIYTKYEKEQAINCTK